MKSIIPNHNKRILKENVATKEKPCNCRDMSNCAMNWQCNVKSIIIQTATVTPQEPPTPSTATDCSIKQPANNVATQQLSQTAVNAATLLDLGKRKLPRAKS